MAVPIYMKMLSKAEKLPTYMDIHTLDTYCELLLNDRNKCVTFANLLNLHDLIKTISDEKFKNESAKMARYEFCRLYLEARIENGVTSRKTALAYVLENVSERLGDIIQREIIDSIEPDSLSKEDIVTVNEMVFSQLNVAFMKDYVAPLKQIVEDLESGKLGRSKNDSVNLLEFFDHVAGNLRKAKRRSRKENRFNLTDPNLFNGMLAEFIDRALSDANYWLTGMQGLNRMLSGGIEDGRIYNFMGPTGGGKSATFLNLLKQLKIYNKGHVHKDMTKRPTILFISQENNVWETMFRIFAIFGSIGNIKQFDGKKIREIMANGGFRIVDDENDIDIEFRYYGNMEVGVPDIRGIIDELDGEGREVIGVIQDYIERLRPPHLNVERRLQLGDVSNQLHDLAQDLDIWVITGTQFNREGIGTVEDMHSAGKRDAAKQIGSKHASESIAMMKNFDVNIVIVPEYDAEEERYYMTFRLIKFRGDDRDNLDYFCQPFVGKNSKIRFMEDLNEEKPLYRLSMVDETAATLVDEFTKYERPEQRASSLLSRGTFDLDAGEPLTEDDIAQLMNSESFKASMGSATFDDAVPRKKKGKFVTYDNGFISFIPYTDVAA